MTHAQEDLKEREQEMTFVLTVQELDKANAKKRALYQLLSSGSSVGWDPVRSLLSDLSLSRSRFEGAAVGIDMDGDSGRLIVNALVDANPPPDVLETALDVFPAALQNNPAAFFAACSHGVPRLVSLMMSRSVVSSGGSGDSCQYPWIFSEHVSVEGAQAVMEASPADVLKPSVSLSGLCPLDFFLLSPRMMAQRSFDSRLWSKFKRMLLAAECSEIHQRHQEEQRISNSISSEKRAPSPVHVMLKRVFAHPDFFINQTLAHHVLWILHQLRSTDPWIFQRQAGYDMYPVHVVLSHECQSSGENSIGASRELIKILLEACPESSKQRDAQGRSPLHLAIENRWPCHDLLLMLNPDALNDVDPATGLFPFQSSALYDACRGARQASITPDYTPSVATAPTPPTEEAVEVCDISVTFELLRASPSCAAVAGSPLARRAPSTENAR